MSLVCLKWYLIERFTRISLTLRGNIRDFYLVPTCFRAVTDLDLSFLSPWGHPLDSSPNPFLLAQLLRNAFPWVVSLTVYVRNPSSLHFLIPQWPNLRHVKVIRWHQRSSDMPLGSDFVSLLEHCHMVTSLDVSNFYCWAEDLPSAIEAYPSFAVSLSRLNILNKTSTEGFKSRELLAVTASCPTLRELLATCTFDHRFIGFVSDQTLRALSSNCPFLSLLHLVDATSLSNASCANLNPESYISTASINHATLADVFARLPLLEELVLDVCHNVRDAWPALESLNSRCPRLKSLKLGQFQGICKSIDSRPDGVALCQGLEYLSIKSSADLTDTTLVAISRSCPKLSKFEVIGCKKITGTGIWKLSNVLRKTLVDVKISYCQNLNAAASLQALEPIQDRIERLHIDCVWESVEQPTGQVGCSSNQPSGRFENIQTGKRGIVI